MISIFGIIRRNPLAFLPILVLASGLQLWTFVNSPSATAAPTTTELTLPTGLTVPNNRGINDISVSADGSKLVIVSGSVLANPIINKIYTSSDSGATWVETTPTSLSQTAPYVPTWVVSSSSGQQVIVATYTSGSIYLSNDYGATWTQKDLTALRSSCNNGGFLNHNLGNAQSTGFAMSPDGAVIAMNVFNSTCMFVSTDSGANFSKVTLPASQDKQGALHISQAENAIWFAKSNTAGSISAGGLWKLNTTNWTWSGNYSATVGLPRGLTGSVDGRILYTAGGSGYSSTAANNFLGAVYRSTDAGVTFSPMANTSKNWFGIKASADGTKLIGWDALNTASNIWISEDSGANWTLQHSPGLYINSVDFSADGSAAYMTMGMYNTPTPTTRVYRYTFPVASTTTITSQSQSVIYGATETLTATINVGGATATTAIGTVSFYDNSTLIPECNNVTVSSGIATCPSTSLSAGEHTNITASYSGGGSISASNSGPSSTVSVAKAELSVIPTAISVEFGGTPSYLKAYSGFKNGQSSSSASFTTGLTPPTCKADSYTTSTSVGSSPLSITCSSGVSNNYTFSYTSTANLTITQATPTVSLALSAATPTYGAIDTITATASIPGIVDFKVGGVSISGCGAVSTAISAPYTAQCLWSPGAASTSYSLTASLSPTNTVDYNSANSATTTTSNSNKASITVTPTAGQSKVYGTSDPVITYSVTSGAMVGSDQLSGALTYASAGQNTATGSYAISSGTLTNANNPNYTITLTSVNFTITKANQSAVSLSSLSAAYNPSNKSVSLTGSGGSGSGGFEYALHVSNTTAGCSVSGSSLNYTTAGTCVIAVKRTTDTNYLERTDAVSFSIGLASQTITFGSLSAKNYSSETFTVSASSSASLTVVFTSGSPTTCTTSGTSGSTITLLGVGTCVINANQAGDLNVAAASQVSQNFTVNARAITVTADAKTKAYGAADPTFTYTITTGSLVLGDAITGALTRATGTDVGTYQIQQGALTTTNNPKYAITFASADLTITRVTPTLVLTYPNSNVAILRPGATDTPTATTSSSSGLLTFATTAASSICTVETTTGVISLFGAGSCPVAMTTALTTNFTAFTETTTVTVALLSTSLVGIDPSDLISMGQPFFSHASIDQSYSFTSGSNGASVAIPAGTLDPAVPISISLLTDAADQRAMIGGTGTSVLSVVVSWVASDGSVPNTNTGKAISVTLTNPAIKSGAKIYSIIGNQSTLLGTATADGSVTTLITEDPVLLVINPVAVAPQLVTAAPQSVNAPTVDNSEAIAAANAKLEADKNAAELKAAADKKAAQEAEAAALKVAAELADAKAQAAAELKAAQEKVTAELRIAEELRLAQLKAEEDLKLAAQKKAADDAALAAKAAKPAVTLYSVSPSLKLNAYNSAYLQKYVKSLKNGASVTCIGYSYSKNTTLTKANALAKSQATAVCALMKKTNKTLKTSVVVYPATKAPKAATGAKWVGVSYRIDGFKR
jgi:hypothetical protein